MLQTTDEHFCNKTYSESAQKSTSVTDSDFWTKKQPIKIRENKFGLKRVLQNDFSLADFLSIGYGVDRQKWAEDIGLLEVWYRWACLNVKEGAFQILVQDQTDTHVYVLSWLTWFHSTYEISGEINYNKKQ